MHEAVHGILFRNRQLNRWVGFLCGLPAFLSVTAYRVGHLPHHRHERTERDPDELENFSKDPRILAVLFCLTFLAGELFGFYRVGPANAWHGRRENRQKILLEYGLIAAAFAAAFATVPIHIMLHVWVFPALVARQLTNVRTLAEHTLTDPGERITATRTVLSNWFVSFFMCNLNYHIEHHLYPAVPWYNLRKLHALLNHDLRRRGAQIYASYTRFLYDLAAFIIAALGPAGRTLPLRLPVTPPA
jgi:fatty acid desaturase